MKKNNIISNPSHYNNHPSTIECKDIAEEMRFSIGSAFKYVYRRHSKDTATENLQKAAQFLLFEQQRLINRTDHTAKAGILIAHEPDMLAKKFYQALWHYHKKQNLKNLKIAFNALTELTDAQNKQRLSKKNKTTRTKKALNFMGIGRPKPTRATAHRSGKLSKLFDDCA